MRDSAQSCFDSRGVVRGERLRLEVDNIVCWTQSQDTQTKPQDNRQYLQPDGTATTIDIKWDVQFAAAHVFLIYPERSLKRQKHSEGKNSNTNSAQESYLHCMLYKRRIWLPIIPLV